LKFLPSHVEAGCAAAAAHRTDRPLEVAHVLFAFLTRSNMTNAFVLMPFGPVFDTYYADIYVPALREAGMRVTRADSLYASVPILDDIREGIANADLLLADLTGRNPNVFYELGHAHALGKAVILTAQSLEDLPFDLRHLRTIIYSTSRVDWAERLRDDVVSSARDFKSRNRIREFHLPVTSEMIERRKVEVVRWHRLSPSEQAILYDRFTNLKGEYYVPTRPLAPAQMQISLQEQWPIDLELFDTLRSSFAPSAPPATASFPMTMEQLLELRSLRDPIIDGIVAALDRGFSQGQRDTFRRLYDYLVAPECHASLSDQSICDLIIVLGARRGHSFRADAALQVAHSATNPTLFLSGGTPIYDTSEELVASEAEAMAYYLVNIRKAAVKNMIVDNRARTTLESAMHAIVAGMALASDLGRPITAAVVTSAYHIRRSYLIFERALTGFRNTIERLRAYKAGSHVADWSAVAGTAVEVENNDRRYAIGLYVVEYLKLLGGRAAGEF